MTTPWQAKNNEVAGIAAVGLTLQLLLKSGGITGIVVQRQMKDQPESTYHEPKSGSQLDTQWL